MRQWEYLRLFAPDLDRVPDEVTVVDGQHRSARHPHEDVMQVSACRGLEGPELVAMQRGDRGGWELWLSERLSNRPAAESGVREDALERLQPTAPGRGNNGQRASDTGATLPYVKGVACVVVAAVMLSALPILDGTSQSHIIRRARTCGIGCER
jgi:hypothetical protein